VIEDAFATGTEKKFPVVLKESGAINPQRTTSRIKSFFADIPHRLPVLKKVDLQ
jgi:hypothetical protein